MLRALPRRASIVVYIRRGCDVVSSVSQWQRGGEGEGEGKRCRCQEEETVLIEEYKNYVTCRQQHQPDASRADGLVLEDADLGNSCVSTSHLRWTGLLNLLWRTANRSKASLF